MISLIIPYLLYSILLSKPKKKKRYPSLSFSSTTRFSLFLSPPLLFHLHSQVAGWWKKKKKATIAGCTMGFLITTIDKQILSATKFWRWSVLMPIPQPVIIDHQKHSILMFEMNGNEKNWYLHPFFFPSKPSQIYTFFPPLITKPHKI